MRTSLPFMLVLGAALTACSGGSKEPVIQDLEGRPLAASEDPVNRHADTTVDALILTLTIDSAAVRLDTAVLTRIPPPAAGQPTGEGDRVTVVGFAGGTRVSEASVPDATLNAQEGTGLVRLTRRQVVVALPAPRALDTIEVTAPGTGASARLDVRAAYAQYCPRYQQDNPYCPPPARPGRGE